MLGHMEQILAQQEQVSNSGLDHKLCLNCQKNPANPTHIPGVQAGGILCRKCQRGVVAALMSHEHPDSRAARIAREKSEAAARESRKVKEGIEADLYL